MIVRSAAVRRHAATSVFRCLVGVSLIVLLIAIVSMMLRPVRVIAMLPRALSASPGTSAVVLLLISLGDVSRLIGLMRRVGRHA